MPKNEYNVGTEKSRAPIGPGGPGGGLGGGMGQGEKAENFGEAISRLVSYSKNYLLVVGIAIILAVAGAVLNIIGPGKLSDITDLITEGLTSGINIEAVMKIVWLLVALYGLGFVFNICQGVIMATVTQKISKSLRSDFSRKINHLPLKYFDGTTIGNILSLSLIHILIYHFRNYRVHLSRHNRGAILSGRQINFIKPRPGAGGH